MTIHSYAQEAEFERCLPSFKSILDSFQYDLGYEFVPRSGARWLRPTLKGALIGAVVGAAVGLVLALLKKLRSSSG